MASGLPDVTAKHERGDNPEECPGKKSRFQTFKNFFVRKKRKETTVPPGDSGLKASQSSDNVSSPETTAQPDSGRDSGSKVNMGNKTMSHDSIFVADSPSSEVNEGLESSQDSIHEKVKSLQLQLKQAIRLTPPSLICMKKGEDTGSVSEVDGLPCSPPEIYTLHSVLGGSSHKTSNQVQRKSSLSMEGFDSDDDQMSLETSSQPISRLPCSLVDFSQPATPSSCLGNSAARHRIAVRQRACAQRKPASRDLLESGKTEAEAAVIQSRLSTILAEVLSGEEKNEEILTENIDASEQEQKAEDEELPVFDESLQKEQISPNNSCEEEEAMAKAEQELSRSLDSDISPPPSPSLSSSFGSLAIPEELISDPQKLNTASSKESLASLECPAGHEEELLPTVKETGSLLQEVLSSLDHPLTSAVTAKESVEEEEADIECLEACVAKEQEPFSPVLQQPLVEVANNDICSMEGEMEDHLPQEQQKGEDEEIYEDCIKGEEEESVPVDPSDESEVEEEDQEKEEVQSTTQKMVVEEMNPDLPHETDLSVTECDSEKKDDIVELSVGVCGDHNESQTEATTSTSEVRVEFIIVEEPSLSPSHSPEPGVEDAPEEAEMIRATSPEQSKVKFTIAPAWQRAHSHPTAPITCISSEVQTPEATSTEGGAENPFGIRLRKTSLRVLLSGEELVDARVTQPVAPEQSRHPCSEVTGKPELQDDGIIRRNPDTAGSGGPTASPIWVLVARQKQKTFIENSLVESPEKSQPSEERTQINNPLPILPRSINKDQAKLSGAKETGTAEKDVKRVTALNSDEPPWLALAKKKAKAWSEMPQIVQ